MPRHRVVLLAVSLVLPACSRAITSNVATATPRASARAPESRVYDSKAGRFITMEELVEKLSRADVVFIGEQHDDPATHRAELAYLAAIGAKRDNVVVSLEMFERDVQSVVDSYLTGSITDSVFLATSRPWPNYIKDYRPLVELARARGWPVLASNIPRRLASAVSKAGLAAVDTMPAGDRALMARDLSCPHDTYFERFAEEMSGHSAGGGGASAADASAAAAMTNRFYEAQCTKDETMAESIVAAMDRAGPGAVVVHFNGAFHSNMHLGTAARVARRRPGARVVVVTAAPVDAIGAANPGELAALGDYILLTPKPPGPAR